MPSTVVYRNQMLILTTVIKATALTFKCYLLVLSLSSETPITRSLRLAILPVWATQVHKGVNEGYEHHNSNEQKLCHEEVGWGCKTVPGYIIEGYAISFQHRDDYDSQQGQKIDVVDKHEDGHQRHAAPTIYEHKSLEESDDEEDEPANWY